VEPPADRPAPTTAAPQELYGDRGHDHWTCDEAAGRRGYPVRIARRSGGWFRADAPPPPDPPQYRGRRWIVERTLAWLSKCRGLLVRYEKKAANHLGFVMVACSQLWYRRGVRNRDS
jgi:putative transposase